MKRWLLSTVGLTFALAASAAAQQTVFVVRHAERADAAAGGPAMLATDPELSDAGRARAQSLASALKDAGITAIIVTEFKRTQQTAEPLAKALGIQPTVVTAKDPAGVAEKVKASTGNALVVGHSNTVSDVITRLGVETPVTLTDAEYDNLFVVVRGEKSTLVRIHYR